ncbi:MAG: 5-formyltetrahydrofolate cyclo-ligase [Alphaproteobacteria bacterium]|nr:5-formyltetrahydrofolate cyclo-ligase [Alphaproteobacteria bacterium]
MADLGKQALRVAARRNRAKAAKRYASPAGAVAAFAADILELAPAADAVISAYLAIGSELDPAPIAAELVKSGAAIALPVMIEKATPLEFRRWSPGDPLVERMWGIREPAPHAAVVEPDVLLVPLLYVDRAGNRLGYGGGFYDRTLRLLRSKKKIAAVGLAFDEQRVDAVPCAPYDEPLDYLLTPSGLVEF